MSPVIMSLSIKPITEGNSRSQWYSGLWLIVCRHTVVVIVEQEMNSSVTDSDGRSNSCVVLQAAASTSSTFADDWTAAAGSVGVGRSSTCRRKREPLLGLIVAALRDAGDRGLVLSSIYRHVIEHSADYAEADSCGAASSSAAWRKNVRHILSVRNFFIKTAEQNPDGRGRFWRLDEVKYAEFIAERSEPTETRDRRPVSNTVL